MAVRRTAEGNTPRCRAPASVHGRAYYDRFNQTIADEVGATYQAGLSHVRIQNPSGTTVFDGTQHVLKLDRLGKWFITLSLGPVLRSVP